jgi:TonB family protein
MTMQRGLWLALLTCVACGRGGDAPADGGNDTGTGFEPPVLTNPDVPVRYPPDLYRDRTEGTVVLRLFVDEAGAVVADSTRVAEGSGVAAFDSAALAAVPAMQFAPARQDGVPIGAAFLQPVQFRHPDVSGTGGGT